MLYVWELFFIYLKGMRERKCPKNVPCFGVSVYHEDVWEEVISREILEFFIYTSYNSYNSEISVTFNSTLGGFIIRPRVSPFLFDDEMSWVG